MTKYTIQKG